VVSSNALLFRATFPDESLPVAASNTLAPFLEFYR